MAGLDPAIARVIITPYLVYAIALAWLQLLRYVRYINWLESSEMPQIIVSEETFARLQSAAVPLVDTVDSVIARALDALLGESRSFEGNRKFNPSSPPDLSFTTVRQASVDDALLPASETYWNSILIAVIRAVAKHGAVSNQISKNLLANHVHEQKKDGGYKFIPEAGLSVQGQDANKAWRSTAHLADAFGIPVEIIFSWQNNSKAALPGETAKLSVQTNNTR